MSENGNVVELYKVWQKWKNGEKEQYFSPIAMEKYDIQMIHRVGQYEGYQNMVDDPIQFVQKNSICKKMHMAAVDTHKAIFR